MNKKKITILQMNDSHGYMQEHWEHFYKGNESYYLKAGGYARISSYLKELRKDKKKNLLFFDGGDTLHGTYPVVDSKGKILIPLLNSLDLDAMTAHWDFAYGPKAFIEILEELNYPMLAINSFYKDNDKLVFPPYKVIEVGDVKVGVIGIAATIIDKVMPPHFSKGIYFTLGNQELPQYIKELKEERGVDLIIVLSHLGFPQEIKLSQEVKGIDLLLSSHTHNRIYEPVKIGDTIIIQSGCHGSFLGHVDLVLEEKKIIDLKHQLVLLDQNIEEDPEIKALVDKAMEPYQDKLNKVLGKTTTDLSRFEVLESTMDNFLLQAMLEHSGAEIAFSNGWRYGAPIPKGDITENDLWNIIPVNPPLSEVTLTGKEIWDMLEENLERTFSKDPYQQMGGYVKRFMGMSMYFKFENPYGERIQELFVGEDKIVGDKEYRAVYVTSQGVPERYGKNRKNLDIDAIDALKKYIKSHGTIAAPLTGNIKGV